MIKKILGLTAIIAALIFTPTTAGAQKTGYIYFDSVILKMPEKAKIDTILQNISDKLTSEIQKATVDCQNKYEAYEQNLGLPEGHPQKWTKSKYALMEQEIRSCQQGLEDQRQMAEKEFMDENQKLLKPIVEKAKKAVEEVSKEKGYTFVVNANSGNIIYSLPQDDLTAAVMKKLNLK